MGSTASGVLNGNVHLLPLLPGAVTDPKRVTRLATERDMALTDRWYESVRAGRPDYGVYLEDDHVADVWACWLETSRLTLRKLTSGRALESGSILADLQRANPQVIVDLGCGLGLTTAVLKEWFPYADVVGTNFPGCAQYRIAEQVAAQYGFRMIPTPEQVGDSADLVLASEYFEHFEAPVDHLTAVLNVLKPRALIINNTFTVSSIGHFPAYLVDGQSVSGRATSRAFNQVLRDRGYIRCPAKLWNNRPAYWMKP